ncbi:MAG: hypothetical protein ACYCZW_01550 [Minisyncoccota bacterium]
MINEQVVSMEELCQKLKNLRELIPEDFSDGLLYHFGEYMAERLNQSSIVPTGFIMGCELALYDLEKGVNGFTGKPIQNSIVGYPSMNYSLLRQDIARIAQVVFPPEFAAEVNRHFEAIQADMRTRK